MKVLLINHFPLEGSGSGTYTKNIALHLRKRGHEVCVIFPENRPVLMLPGIRMFPVMFSTGKASWSSLPFNFPCFTTHPQSRTTFADLSSGELAQYLTLFSSVLRQAVREFQPDVIHAQHAWCLSWLASLCDIPLVVTIHGTDLMGCRKWPVFRGFAEEAIAGSAKVLAISQDNRDLALSVLPSCANKLLLLPNGYNEDIFYPEEVDRESLFDSLGLPYRGEYIVLFAGKLAEFKGVDTPLRVTNIKPGMVETNFTVVRYRGDKQAADNFYKGIRPLTGDDIAETVYYAASAPAHIQIAEVLLMPTYQATGTISYKKKAE